MKLLKTKSKWFDESDLRLDAEYHLSDGPKTRRLFKSSKIKTEPLKDVVRSIYKGQIFKRCYVKNPEYGLPFLTASDMVKGDIESGLFLSKKYTEKQEDLLIDKDWILISRSGTLGQIVFTNDVFKGKIGTDDLIRILPNQSKLKSGYLYAFLASRFGYSLLTQSSYGGVVKHIEPHHIENIPIPIIKETIQVTIDEKITKAAKLRSHANSKLKEAMSYFENLFTSTDEYKKVFIKNSEDFKFSWVGRNNDVIAESWIKQIKSEKHVLINDMAERVFSPNIFKHIYLEKDNGYPFFTGAELAKSFRLKYRFLSEKGVKDINDYVVKENTLVVYKSGPRNGMIGDVFLIDKELNNACLSDHVIRIEIEDVELNFWCFAFLRSKVGKRILHNLATGTAILFITPERLQNIPIPKPNKYLKKVTDNVKEYINAFNKAHMLEKDAINIIEREIESWQK